jgi:hypothetical protein
MTTTQRFGAAATVAISIFLGFAVPYFVLPRNVLLWAVVLIAAVLLSPRAARLATGSPEREFPSHGLVIGTILGLTLVGNVMLQIEGVREPDAPSRTLSDQLGTAAVLFIGATVGGVLGSYVTLRRASSR